MIKKGTSESINYKRFVPAQVPFRHVYVPFNYKTMGLKGTTLKPLTMKIIKLILFSFCILLQGCKNEPKELLENKMYLIPIISNDSILVFGKTNISSSQLPLFKKVFEINEKKIIAVELLIEEKFLNYCKLKNMYLYNELKNVNFDQLRRQYLFFEDTKGSKNIIVRLWNPNFTMHLKNILIIAI
ncbi:MAG: hypothetical protein IPF63_09860 [Bacteroidetes bacterium]|nr:hypothetical protein [Bacteroidota bacterium]